MQLLHEMQDKVDFDPKQEYLKEAIKDHFKKRFPELEIYIDYLRKTAKHSHRQSLMEDRMKLPHLTNVLDSINKIQNKKKSEREEAQALAKEYKMENLQDFLESCTAKIDTEDLAEKLKFLMNQNYISDEARLEIIVKQLRFQDRKERLKEIEEEQKKQNKKSTDLFNQLVKVYTSKAYEKAGYSHAELRKFQDYLQMKPEMFKGYSIEKNQKIRSKIEEGPVETGRSSKSFFLRHFSKLEDLLKDHKSLNHSLIQGDTKFVFRLLTLLDKE